MKSPTARPVQRTQPLWALAMAATKAMVLPIHMETSIDRSMPAEQECRDVIPLQRLGCRIVVRDMIHSRPVMEYMRQHR